MSRAVTSGSRSAAVVVNKIQEFRIATQRRDWSTAVLIAITVTVAIILIAVVADFVFVFNGIARWVAFLCIVTLPSLVIWRCVFYRRRERLSDRSVAEQIEELDSRAAGFLLSAVDLQQQLQIGSSERPNEFHYAALRQAAREVEQISARQLVNWSRPNRLVKYACLTLLVSIFLSLVPQLEMLARCRRVLMPWQNLPSVTFYTITTLDTDFKKHHVAADEFSRISARAVGPSRLEHARFEIRRIGEPESLHSERISNTKPLSPDEHSFWNLQPKKSAFEANIKKPVGVYEFRFSAGDYVQQWQSLEVSERPKFDHVTFTITPPPYSHDTPRKIKNETGSISVVRNSTVTVDFTASEPVAVDNDLRSSFTLTGVPTGNYEFRLLDEHLIEQDLSQPIRFRAQKSGLDNSLLDRLQIVAVEDLPPTVQWLGDFEKRKLVKLGQPVQLSAVAEDEFTLNSVVFQQRLAADSAGSQQQWRDIETEIQTNHSGEKTTITTSLEVSGFLDQGPNDYEIRIQVTDAAGQSSYSRSRHLLFVAYDLNFSRSEIHELKRQLLTSLRDSKRILENRVPPERVRNVIAAAKDYTDSRAERLELVDDMRALRDVMQASFSEPITILKSAQSIAKRKSDSQSLVTLSQLTRLQLAKTVAIQDTVIERITRSTQPNFSSTEFEIQSELNQFNQAFWHFFRQIRTIVTLAEELAYFDSIEMVLNGRRQMLPTISDLTAEAPDPSRRQRLAAKLLTIFGTAIQQEFELFPTNGRQPWEQFVVQSERFAYQMRRVPTNASSLLKKYESDLLNRVAPNDWCTLTGQLPSRVKNLADDFGDPVQNALSPTTKFDWLSSDQVRKEHVFHDALQQLRLYTDINTLNRDGGRVLIEDLELIQSAVKDLELRYDRVDDRFWQPELQRKSDLAKLDGRREDVSRAAEILETYSLLRQTTFLTNSFRKRESSQLESAELRTASIVLLANIEWLLSQARRAISDVDVPRELKNKIANTSNSQKLAAVRQSLSNRIRAKGSFLRLHVELSELLDDYGAIANEMEPLARRARDTLRIDKSTLSQRVSDLASKIDDERIIGENTEGDIRELAEEAAARVARASLNSKTEIERTRALFRSSQQLSRIANKASDMRRNEFSKPRISQSTTQIVNQLREIARRLAEFESIRTPTVEQENRRPTMEELARSVDEPLSNSANEAFEQSIRLASIASMSTNEIIDRIFAEATRKPDLALAIEDQIEFDLQRLSNELINDARKLQSARKAIATNDHESASVQFVDKRLRSVDLRWRQHKSQTGTVIQQLANRLKLDLPGDFDELRSNAALGAAWRPIDRYETAHDSLDRHGTDLEVEFEKDLRVLQESIGLLTRQFRDPNQIPEIANLRDYAQSRITDLQTKVERLYQRAIEEVASQQPNTDAELSRISQLSDRLRRQFADLSKLRKSNPDDAELKQQYAELRKQVYAIDQELNRASRLDHFQREATDNIKQEFVDFQRNVARERPGKKDSISELLATLNATNQQVVQSFEREINQFSNLSKSLAPKAYTGDFDRRSADLQLVAKHVSGVADEIRNINELIQSIPANDRRNRDRDRISKIRNQIYAFSDGQLTDLAQRLKPSQPTQSSPLQSESSLSKQQTAELLLDFESSRQRLLELAGKLLSENNKAEQQSTALSKTDSSSNRQSKDSTPSLSHDDIAALLNQMIRKSNADPTQRQANPPTSEPNSIDANDDDFGEDQDAKPENTEQQTSEIISQTQRNLGRRIADLLRQSLDNDSAPPNKRQNPNRPSKTDANKMPRKSTRPTDSDTSKPLEYVEQNSDALPTKSGSGPPGSMPSGSEDVIDIIDIDGESTWGQLRKRNAAVESESQRSQIPEQYREISRQYLRAISELNKRTSEQ